MTPSCNDRRHYEGDWLAAALGPRLLIRARLEAAIAAVGRVDFIGYPGLRWGGTAFVVGPELLMTKSLSMILRKDGERNPRQSNSNHPARRDGPSMTSQLNGRERNQRSWSGYWLSPPMAIYFAENVGFQLGAINPNQEPTLFWRDLLTKVSRAGLLGRFLEEICSAPQFAGVATKLRAYL